MLNLSRDRLLTWIVTAIVVWAFLLVDFFTPFVFADGRHGLESNWLTATVLGVCIGQLNLVAAWAALAPGNVALRLPWTLLLSVLSWYALVLGNRAAYRSSAYFTSSFSLGEALLLGGTLLGGVLAAQLPLWIASRGLGFRLVQRPHASAARGNQFQLRHIMLGMVLLCVALAPLREVLPREGRFDVATRLLPRISLLFAAAVVCNMLITLPCLWGAFLRLRTLLLLALAWPFYAAALTFVEIVVLYAILGDPGSSEVPVVFYLCNLSQCVTVTGVLLIFRAIGFRLVRVERRRPARAVNAPP